MPREARGRHGRHKFGFPEDKDALPISGREWRDILEEWRLEDEDSDDKDNPTECVHYVPEKTLNAMEANIRAHEKTQNSANSWIGC